MNKFVWTPAAEARYRAYADENDLKSFRVAFTLAPALAPSGIVLHYFLHREYFGRLTWITIIMTLWLVVVRLLAESRIVRKHILPSVVIGACSISLGVTAWVLTVGGFESTYYTGILGILIGVGAIFRWHWSRMLPPTIGVLACYYLPLLAHEGFEIHDFGSFLNNTFWLLFTSVVALASGNYREGVSRESFARLLTIEEGESRLREADELKSRFFANVSHELRTPLGLILGPIEALLASPRLASGERENLKIARKNGRILLARVNELLEAARIESVRPTPRYVSADLSRLVRMSGGLFDLHARERKIGYSIETPEVFHAELDPGMMQRILINLLSNAFKFVPDGGRIKVRLNASGERAILAVEDSGPGVPPRLRESIFERFRQAEMTDARKYGGTGLGLSIAKDYAEAHGGKIWVEDAPSGGARFVVSLPISAPAGTRVNLGPEELTGPTPGVPLPEELHPMKIPLPPAGPGEKKGRVLLVEDNPDLAVFLAGVLSEYRVETASNGREGLRMSRSAPPDLIITDLMMPEMSGEEMIREIRRNPALDHIPILVLTAKADEVLRVSLLREGVQDYVFKPFMNAEVLARVRNLVMIKKAREALREELKSRSRDLEDLVSSLVQRKRELQQAYDALALVRRQLESAALAKIQFLTLISHELLTPLTTISVSIELLGKNWAELELSQRARIFESLRVSIQRLHGMITTLLDYSRMGLTGLSPRLENIDLVELASQTMEELRKEANDKGLEFRLETPAQPCRLNSDRRLVGLILTHLIGNAIKYTNRGGVDVKVDRVGDSLQVSVHDTGIGIPSGKIRSIFEPFLTLEPLEFKHAAGAGVGLALVKEILRALHGTIDVVSEIDKGSTFIVTLPVSFAAGPGVRAA